MFDTRLTTQVLSSTYESLTGAAVACAAVLAFTGPLAAQTEVGGTILADTTWTAASSPYVVTSSIVIGNDATLTIEPGVEVRFKLGLGLTVGSSFGPGALFAVGSEEQPILFTSNEPYEPFEPGDPEPEAAPGDWRSIIFAANTVHAEYDEDDNYIGGSIMEHVIVEYAGAGVATAAVSLEQGIPLLSHCEIRHNSRRGIIVVGGAGVPAARIEYCKVWDNVQSGNGGGISISGSTKTHVLIGNHVHNNMSIGSAGQGGGIFINGQVVLTDNVVADNTASATAINDTFGGGGIRLTNAGQSMVIGNTVSGNSFTHSAAHLGWGHSGGVAITSSPGIVLHDNQIVSNTTNTRGGGLYVAAQSGGATYTDNLIADNQSGREGGGAFIWSSGSSLFLNNVISNNTTVGAADGSRNGGGFYLTNCPSTQLINNAFTGNTSAWSGGALIILSSNNSTLTGNTFDDNTAAWYGGFAVWSCSSPTVTSNFIQGNHATMEVGGFHLTVSPNATVTGNLIQGNSAGENAGGMHIQASHNAVVRGNVITGNSVLSEPDTKIGGLRIAGNSTGVTLAGDPDENIHNVIHSNSGFQIGNFNAFNSNGSGDVIATHVNWGTSDMGEIQDGIYDHFNDGSLGIVLWFPFAEPTIPGDLTGDGSVGVADLLILLAAWGPCDECTPSVCPADLDGDCTVGVADLLILLSNWR